MDPGSDSRTLPIRVADEWPAETSSTAASDYSNGDKGEGRCLREMRFIVGLRGIWLHFAVGRFESMDLKEGFSMQQLLMGENCSR